LGWQDLFVLGLILDPIAFGVGRDPLLTRRVSGPIFSLGRVWAQIPLGSTETHSLGGWQDPFSLWVQPRLSLLLGPVRTSLLLGPTTVWPLFRVGKDPSPFLVRPRLGPFLGPTRTLFLWVWPRLGPFLGPTWPLFLWVLAFF
jgi:hypothetical protein